MPSETVSFDVGGRIFKVRRSLLEGFPSTVLARSASDEWHEGDKPIFIDRDADRFRYCLDFMRDGEIQLPHTESQEAVLKDLEYYGFEDVDPNVIIVQVPVIEAMECLVSVGNDFDDELAMAKVEADTAIDRLMHMKVARACFNDYKHTLTGTVNFGNHLSDTEKQEFAPRLGKLKWDLLNEYLKKFDLQAVKYDEYCFGMTVEPL